MKITALRLFNVKRFAARGVAIELKRQKGGTTSPEQREWLENLENHGWCCAVCKGWEEAREFLAGLGWNE